MAKFVVKRRLPLNFLGKEWKEAFLEFKALSIKELRELVSTKLTNRPANEIMTFSYQLVKKLFIKGMGPDETGKLVKIQQTDLEELPGQVMEKAINFLVGGLEEPKKS